MKRGDTYDRAQLERDLVREEGKKLRVYLCSRGKRTIGVGRNLDAIGIRPGETSALGITRASCLANGITDIQAMVLLDNDIGEVVDKLDLNLPWWRQLNARRQRVLIQMAFQMGIGGLLGFKNTLTMIKRGEYSKAADGMLHSKWAREDSPARAARLSRDMALGG